MKCDALVVGSGPNGMAAAITLARAGLNVRVYEASASIGGGTRSAELTLPSFVHDICSAVHPLAVASPFFRSLALEDYGLRWIHPAAPLAHPLEGGRSILLENDLDRFATSLGSDGGAYREMFAPLVRNAEALFGDILGPLRFPAHPLELVRFGLKAILPVTSLVRLKFEREESKALLGGLAAHSALRLSDPISAAVALVLAIAAHSRGWPIPAGGSGAIADALEAYFRSMGGEIVAESPIGSIDELPSARLVLFDVTPWQFAKLCKSRLPARYLEKLLRFQKGPGVFKMDFALSAATPWTARECLRAGTVHLGGSLDEIRRSEQEVHEGKVPEKPFVLVAQQSLFDPSRAPEGKHTLWAYCHVPNGSSVDMSTRIENQIERFAPGFKDLILSRHIFSPAELERYNMNYAGGDISGGLVNWRQLFSRPVSFLHPYRTPSPGLYLCSASTPPGPGVHGMCGYHAARAALEYVAKLR